MWILGCDKNGFGLSGFDQNMNAAKQPHSSSVPI